MDFKILNKQKKYMLVAALIGIFSMFLPFISFGGIFSVNAINYGGVAYIVLACFGLITFFCLTGDKTQPLGKVFWIISIIAGCLAAAILIINFFSYFEMIEFIGIGFYLCIITSLMVSYYAYSYRDYGMPIDLYHESYDSMEFSSDEQKNEPGKFGELENNDVSKND